MWIPDHALALALRASLVWLGLCVLAFANGALREIVLKQQLKVADAPAHKLSVATGIFIWTLFTVSLWGWLAVPSLSSAMLVGAFWLLATLMFETYYNNRDMTWQQISHTYDLAAGELWGLVVVWIGVMPVVLFLVLK